MYIGLAAHNKTGMCSMDLDCVFMIKLVWGVHVPKKIFLLDFGPLLFSLKKKSKKATTLSNVTGPIDHLHHLNT